MTTPTLDQKYIVLRRADLDVLFETSLRDGVASTDQTVPARAGRFIPRTDQVAPLAHVSRQFDDSDRNIMASMQHEACEACFNCGEHICTRGDTKHWEFKWQNRNVCEDCLGVIMNAIRDQSHTAQTAYNYLLSTTDAQVWARAFCEMYPDADEGVMITWFANAIETGRSAGMR